MVLSGQAQGKLLLFGEHAVVHGFPALGLSLPSHTNVRLSLPDQDIGNVPLPRSDHTELIHTLVSYMGKEAQALWRQFPWHVQIQSNVPMACGLGSSAALTGALARTLAQDASPQTIWHMAHQAEQHFHGQPSGVDTALALGNGLMAVTPVAHQLPELRSCAAGPFAVVVGTVPRERSTRDLVSQVRHQVETDRHRTLAILEQLGHLALRPDAMNDAFAILGDRANQAHTLLQRLRLSTPALDRGLQTGLLAGAYGGKLSGAGGGGAFILFCEDLASANQVAVSIGPDCTCQPSIYQWNGHRLVAAGDKV